MGGEKAADKACRGCGVGITPAWAGKSISQTSTMRPAKDHPRVGGEKRHLLTLLLVLPGSPPRGRGKVAFAHVTALALGITPAWAGKSYACCPVLSLSEDHPRVGGEKGCMTFVGWLPRGSPPRGRGKGPHLRKQAVRGGSPPRGRGKRHPSRCPPLRPVDHPRVGGEKNLAQIILLEDYGSPPRGRGKVNYETQIHRLLRITPAWAGKSLHKGSLNKAL